MEGKSRNGKRGFTEDNEGGEGDGNLTTKSTKYTKAGFGGVGLTRIDPMIQTLRRVPISRRANGLGIGDNNGIEGL
jgi:hypothetical protein